ncbi:hypothetical protein ACFQ14_03245 [Pseudahrensia aquimaris]|uniref:Uncharacterized protein n=1 Tax=Pseudahrensia aquimaris TaxID=744461 RepID=A0ABW3FAZ9_9HYPH
MDRENRNEPHPALQPSSVKWVRALIAKSAARNGHDNAEASKSAIPVEESAHNHGCLDTKSIVDDPAMAVRLALACAKVHRGNKGAIPQPVVDLMFSHACDGDAACAAVLASFKGWGSLEASDMIAAKAGTPSIRGKKCVSDMSGSAENAGGKSDA